MSAALRETLAAWSDLWRRPALFRLIHGVSSDVSATALRTAMLEVEANDLHAAWDTILGGQDLAAAAAAYDRLAPELGIKEARAGLAQARADFQRRVEAVRDRARPLPMVWGAVDAGLRAADAVHLTEPAAAEQRLADADAMVAQAEQLELEHLARRAEDETAPPGLRAALAAGDLRLAQILAGSADVPIKVARPLAYDLRIEGEPTARLLEWRLAPELAPAWLPSVVLSEGEVGLLAGLAEIADQGGVSLDQAQTFLHRALTFLGAAHYDLTTLDAGIDQMWSFSVRGTDVADLFPHAADDDSRVAMMVPLAPTTALPRPIGGLRVIAWDLFEAWRTDGGQGVMVARPRILLELLNPDVERRTGFVRLISRGIPVRALILHVLGRDEARCRRFAGPPAKGDGAAAIDSLLGRLIEALDLYVDDGDVLALRDAYGARATWMLLALHVVAKSLDAEPASNRRFDALGTLRRPAVQRELEAALDESLTATLEDRFRTALLIDVLEDTLDPDDFMPGLIPPDDLAAVLVREEQAADLAEAKRMIEDLVAAGLLRTAVAPEGGAIAIIPSLPLPARLLLRP